MLVKVSDNNEFINHLLQCHKKIYVGRINVVLLSRVNNNIYARLWGKYYKIESPDREYDHYDIQDALRQQPALDDNIVF